MQRKVQAEDVQHKTHMLREAGIETGMFIMLGYHGETVADLEATLDHLKKGQPGHSADDRRLPHQGHALLC